MNFARHLTCTLLQAPFRPRTWPASVRTRIAQLAQPGARALRPPDRAPPTPTHPLERAQPTPIHPRPHPWRPAPFLPAPLPSFRPWSLLLLDRRASDWDTRRTQALGTGPNAWWRINEAHAAFLPLHAWNLRRCTQLARLFVNTRCFNAPLWTWNTRQVRDLTGLFWDARAFDQPLWTWRVDQVQNAQFLLMNARAFHQPLWPWRLSSLREARGLLYHVSSAGPLHPWPAPSPNADWRWALAGNAPHGPLPHWPADVLAEARGTKL